MFQTSYQKPLVSEDLQSVVRHTTEAVALLLCSAKGRRFRQRREEGGKSYEGKPAESSVKEDLSVEL